MRKISVLAAALLAAAVATLPPERVRAQEAIVTAAIGGLETGKTAIPELVVFNTSALEMTLDLVLRGPNGIALATLPAAMVLGPRETEVRPLQTDLKTAGANGKAYVGVFTVEISGADPFSSTATVVHAVQYFGSRKKPKAGFVVRPLFAP